MQVSVSRPTVVVIIPFFNGAKWVERAIKSVVSQTVPPDEFVIVNDGSKPEERAALDPLSAKYGFRILDKKNGGQGSARNAGVAATTSEFISLLDQDDFYLPHHIEDLASILPESDLRLGYVYADICEADGDGNIINTNMLMAQTDAGMHPKRGHIVNILRNDLFVLPSASLIRRSAFEEVGGFDEQFMGYEDDDLFLRMFRAGYTNYFLDKPVTVWCMHTGSTSWSIKMSRSRFKYFKKLASIYVDDDFKKIYFMRDCLIPRFENSFIDEATKACEESNPDAPEYLAMLREYSEIVSSNSEVDDEYKKKVRRIICEITKAPLREEDLGKFQKSLHLTYKSTSWRVSKPLRLIVNKISGRPVDPPIPFNDDFAHDVFQMVRRSMSWRTTALLRLVKILTRAGAREAI
jgi:glycosyltransferase involved in cell wall biosynthesis